MSERPKFASIDDYLATVSPDVRPILEEIRQIVRRTVPAAQETISYQMPAFKLDHVFIYFAAFKNHIGIFPPVRGDDKLMAAIAEAVNNRSQSARTSTLEARVPRS